MYGETNFLSKRFVVMAFYANTNLECNLSPSILLVEKRKNFESQTCFIVPKLSACLLIFHEPKLKFNCPSLTVSISKRSIDVLLANYRRYFRC